jgi:hypothetical protein
MVGQFLEDLPHPLDSVAGRIMGMNSAGGVDPGVLFCQSHGGSRAFQGAADIDHEGHSPFESSLQGLCTILVEGSMGEMAVAVDEHGPRP